MQRNAKSAALNARSPMTSPRRRDDTNAASKIRFSAKLLRPRLATESPNLRARGGGGGRGTTPEDPDGRDGDLSNWTFLKLPGHASAKLPSRGQVTVEGMLNGAPFQATLQPDGEGGHWLKVERTLREAASAAPGEVVTLEIAPLAEEPEPTVPADLRKALAAAPMKAREAWADITPVARRDFIHWITSGKRAETRVKRIATACDMLAKGKRRPCCFDRSGMYDKSLSCPMAEDDVE